MTQHSKFRSLLLLFVLLASLMVIPFAQAQETGDVVDDTTEAGNEGVAAEESEAQEVGGEEHGIEADTRQQGVATAEGESTNPLVPLGINTGFLVAQIVNFVLIALLLGGLMFRPMVNMLDSRSAKIQRGLEDAAAAANARRNAEAEAEKILAAARTDAARTVEEARARGEEVARQVETAARAEAERIRAEGAARASEERDRQLGDLRGQVAAIAVAMAERLIGQNLDAKRQQTLVDQFFATLPQGARALQGQVEVVSAMPLTPDEQARVRRELGTETVTFTVEPEILGGLIVRGQDQVIDGSVRSGVSEMAARLR